MDVQGRVFHIFLVEVKRLDLKKPKSASLNLQIPLLNKN